MPVKPHFSIKLSLALASITASAGSLANTPADREMAWTCTMNKAQEWTCDVTEQTAPVETESVQISQPSLPVSQPSEATASTSAAAEPVQVSNAPAAPAVATPGLTVGTHIKPPVIIHTPQTKPEQPAQSAQPVRYEQVAGAEPEWQCDGDANGNWQCSQEVPMVPVGQMVAINRRPSQHANPYTQLDWVVDPNYGFCGGYYQAPEFTNQPQQDDAPLFLEAAQSSTKIGGLTKLEGGVKLQQDNRLLSSDYAELDQVTNKASLEGNVSFREPGLLLRGRHAQVDIKSHETLVSDSIFVLHEQEMRGQADRFIRLADSRLRMEQGSFTYCPPGDESWQVAADNITLNKEEGYGTAKHAKLEVAGVPILYLPYFSFPIDDRRRSGFLYPSFSISSDNGVELGVPYYFNLAPNYDATLTPRLFSERGLQLEGEFRYLNSWSMNQTSAAYLPSDDKFGDDRWLLGLEHQSQNNGRWHSKVDFTRVSDKDYYDDLDTMLDVSKEDHLQQLGEVQYTGDGFTALARVQSYQTISDDESPYRRMPQLLVHGGKGWGDFGASYLAEFVSFDRDIGGLTGADRVTGERVHVRPGINYNYQRPWGYIRPSAQIWHSSYQLDDQVTGLEDNPSLTVPVVSLDSGMYFDRPLENGGQQTLEPRLFMLYVVQEDQDDIPVFDTAEFDFNYRSLFRFNRFSGHDRIGDTQQISLGLTSRWIMDDGYEKARFSIGQAYYFDDREVQLPSLADQTDGQSDIASETVWNFSRKWRGTMDLIFDEKFDTSKSNFKLSYKGDLDHRWNLSYRFEENERKQVDTSFIWPLAPQWGLIGRWQYDIDNDENIESLFGVEYEDCCWSIRIAAREWLDDTDNTDSALYIQFFLKGLGSLGSGDSSYLDDISGFKEREEQRND